MTAESGRVPSALFFDDHVENLHNVHTDCPCIFPVLVPSGDAVKSDSQFRAFKKLLSPAARAFAQDMHEYRFDQKKKRELKREERRALGKTSKVLHDFEGTAGADDYGYDSVYIGGALRGDHMRRICKDVASNLVKLLVLDWDNTVQRHSGNFPRLKEGRGMADMQQAIQKLLTRDGRAEATHAGKAVAEYFLGGSSRMSQLHELFQTCASNDCAVLILTRNSNVDVIEDLMRTFSLDPPLKFEVHHTDRERSKLQDLKILALSREYCDAETICNDAPSASLPSDDLSESSSDSTSSSDSVSSSSSSTDSPESPSSASSFGKRQESRTHF